MRDYPELLILRHGETEWNRAGRLQGSLDSALTEKGVGQAHALGGLLRRLGVAETHSAFVSPLGRARHTADIALSGLFDEPVTDDRIAEVHVGDAQGMQFEEAMTAFPHLRDFPGQIGWHFEVPGGEDWNAFSGRIQSFLDDLTGPSVIVAHGVVSRVMRALVLGLGRENLNDLPGGQGNIHRIRDGMAEIITP